MALSSWFFRTASTAVNEPRDGFEQTFIDELRYAWRFRTCKQRAVQWRTASETERSLVDAHSVVTRFGDCTVCVAHADGRIWVVRERDWHGWPNPPQYVFFALDPDGNVWSARDFHHWPRMWARPI